MQTNTATAPEQDEQEKTTLAAKPLTIESLMSELSALTDEQIQKCGNNRPDIADGETVVMAVPDSAQRFFTLAEHYGDLAKAINAELKTKTEEFEFLHDPSDDDFDFETASKAAEDFFEGEMHEKVHQLQEFTSKTKVFADLAWIACRDAIGRSCEDRVGMRKGWQIVKLAPEPESNLGEFLAELFGGGGSIGIGVIRSRDF